MQLRKVRDGIGSCFGMQTRHAGPGYRQYPRRISERPRHFLLPLLPRKGAVPCRTGAEPPAAYGNPKIVRAQSRSPGGVRGDISAPSPLREHRVRAPNMPLARPVADPPHRPISRKYSRTPWSISCACQFSANTRAPRAGGKSDGRSSRLPLRSSGRTGDSSPAAAGRPSGAQSNPGSGTVRYRLPLQYRLSVRQPPRDRICQFTSPASPFRCPQSKAGVTCTADAQNEDAPGKMAS